tara:strand:+ start:158 stop:610 length:453 start_codon:yes stop_codon:yes gene_type:complete
MENLTDRKCVATSWQQEFEGAKHVSTDDCQCPKCYELNGEMMFQIGLACAFQSALNYETTWSVDMDGKRWNLDTKVIDSDEPLTLLSSGWTEDFSDWKMKITARNGTVGELWKACEKAYKKAHKKYGDWHRYIEQFDNVGPNIYEIGFGS